MKLKSVYICSVSVFLQSNTLSIDICPTFLFPSLSVSHDVVVGFCDFPVTYETHGQDKGSLQKNACFPYCLCCEHALVGAPSG